ncbi:EEF1A lysine methyltransferase 2 isoform 2-T2 [Clarias gariepinus]
MASECSHVQESSSGSHAGSGEDFAPSKLGTKEYWENAYNRELQTFRDIGDVGEIWFGEESMNRVIRWMEKQNTPENAAILDIGTGNGVFLVELEQDFLNPCPELKGFDLCIDKGTFDAISLNPEDREMAKLQYLTSLKAALKPQGHFVITSCNWTKEQLLQIFSPGFELLQELPTPCFQFGGVTGNSVTALVLKKLS